MPHEPTRSAGMARVGVDVDTDMARRSAVRTQPLDAAQRDAVLAAALDVWSEHAAEGEPLDVVLDGRGREALTDAGVGFEVLVHDIDAVAAAEQERLADPTAQRPGDWFAEYKDYAAISAYVEGLAAAHPERAHLETIGASLEGRPLYGLRIAGTAADPVRLAINGGQHAREWIAAMVPVCIAERLLS